MENNNTFNKDKCATIQRVESVRHHPGAGRLDILEILGWQVVAAKDQNWKVGDLCVFVPIDTTLKAAEWNAFLGDWKGDKRRVKRAVLRGEISRGLALRPENVKLDFVPTEHDIGMDVSELIGCEPYVKPIPPKLAGEISGHFPDDIVSKTDEVNGLSNPDVMREVIAENPEMMIVSVKYDGCSMTVIFDHEGEISHVCSRNICFKPNPNNDMWKFANKMREKLPIEWRRNCIYQGELCGPGINGNRRGLKSQHLYIFNCFREGELVELFDEMFIENTFAKEDHIDCVHAQMVIEPTIDDLVALANIVFVTREDNGKGVPAEGVVIRPYCGGLNKKTLRPSGFKIINENYDD